MHKVCYKRFSSFNYKLLTEYPYLYAYTKTPKNKDINFFDSFKQFLEGFEQKNIDIFVKAMVGKNTIDSKYHTTKDRWHFHGIVASKIEISLNKEYFKPIYNLDGWLKYINSNHNIGYIFEGYSI